VIGSPLRLAPSPHAEAHRVLAVDPEGAQASTGRRREARPRRLAIHPGWIVVAGAIAVLAGFGLHAGRSGDALWQLAAGNWMLDHQRLITRDVFSYTVHGRPWFAEEWAFEVVLAWGVHVAGSAAFWMASGGAAIVALLASILRWRLLGAGVLGTALLTVVATAGLAVGVKARPQVSSYAFFAVELLLLSLARRDPRWLMAIPFLMAVWANFHGSFLLGLGVLAAEAAASVLPNGRGRIRASSPLPVRSSAATLLAAILAVTLNPHGVRLFGYAAHVTGDSQITSLIQEWQSPNFHSLFLMALVGVPIVVFVLSIASSDATLELVDLVVAGVLFFAVLHAVRFFPYFEIAWCSLAVPWHVVRTDEIRRTRFTLPAAAVIAVLALVVSVVPAGSSANTRSSTAAGAEPVVAAKMLAARGGRVFSTYGWNDYLISLHIPVFVDGRTDLYAGTGVLSQYEAVANLTVNPDSVLDRYGVQWVLWPDRNALSTFLRHDPAWHVVEQAQGALVFGRSASRSR
jgi:hypothetical protein